MNVNISNTINQTSLLNVYYFFYLPKSRVVRWSHNLEHTCRTDYNPADWLLGYRDGVVIPIPVDLALHLGWVTQEEILQEFDLPEHVRAALRLLGVKG